MTTITEGITTDINRFVQAINRLLPFYQPCDPFSGAHPAQHDFLQNLDPALVIPWLKDSHLYFYDEIFDQFESQYLFLTLKKSIKICNQTSNMFQHGDQIDIFDLLFRANIVFSKHNAPIGAYYSIGKIYLVYPNDSDKEKRYLKKYLTRYPIDTLQNQLYRKIDF